jgi:hypothetical protein
MMGVTIDFLTRLEVADFDTWLAVHLANAASGRSYGMVDGGVYRDIDNPNAEMIHTRVEDLGRAPSAGAAFARAPSRP